MSVSDRNSAGGAPLAPATWEREGSWALEGQLVDASNVVIRMVAGDVDDLTAPRAVFKPVAGERPLDDFPAHTLAHREVATHLVADAAGWGCVPPTRWFETDLGAGSLQLWVGPLQPQEHDAVDLIDEDDLDPAAQVPIAAFEGEEGPLLLVHRRSSTLREIALLDAVVNNADRKGSHLIDDGERLWAIDHGLTFHAQDKIRTVLWGFAGEAFTDDERAAIDRLEADRHGLAQRLRAHLDEAEITAMFARLDALRDAGCFPLPPQERYALPWPPL